MSSSRERELWSAFVRQREEGKVDKPARKRRAKKPEPPTQAENDAVLDELVASSVKEAEP
jgi:hypothetical protein